MREKDVDLKVKWSKWYSKAINIVVLTVSYLKLQNRYT